MPRTLLGGLASRRRRSTMGFQTSRHHRYRRRGGIILESHAENAENLAAKMDKAPEQGLPVDMHLVIRDPVESYRSVVGRSFKVLRLLPQSWRHSRSNLRLQTGRPREKLTLAFAIRAQTARRLIPNLALFNIRRLQELIGLQLKARRGAVIVFGPRARGARLFWSTHLPDSPPDDQVKDDHGYGNDQQQVNVPASCMAAQQSEQPQRQQNHTNSPEHSLSYLS